MVQKIIILIFSFTVLIYSSSTISFSLSPLSRTIVLKRDGHDGNATIFEGISIYGEPGQPELPFYTRTFLVPPNADLSTVSVTIGDVAEELLPGEYTVGAALPPCSQGTFFWPENRNIVNGKDIDIYNRNQFFPQQYAGNMTVGLMREFRLVEVTVTPFKYNPVTKSLKRIIGGKLKIQYKTVPGPSAVTANISQNVRDRIKDLVVNFDEFSAWYNCARLQKRDRAQTYYIITTSSVKSASQSLQAFIDSKKARGFNVTVVTESEWGGGTGNTAADNLREWIQGNYQSLAIDYALIIGNPHPESGDMAMKICGGKNIPTDFYFGELSGNWDLNGNGTYGEDDDVGPGGVDKYAEVHTGRIPVYDNDITALDKILAKICTYEKMPATCLSWRTKALLIAKPYDQQTPGSRLFEAIKNTFVDPNGWDCFRIYDDNYGSPDVSTCTEENVLDAWTSRQFGYVSWITHGNATLAADIIKSSSVSQLDDKYPSIVWQGSCTNAHPETNNNLSYSLLKNGAIAAMGASRSSWYSIGETQFEGQGSNQGITYHFSKNVIEDSLPTSDALDKTRGETNITGFWWANCLVFNVYGCPAVGVYTHGTSTPVIGENTINKSSSSITFYNNAVHFRIDAFAPDKKKNVRIDIFNTKGKKIGNLLNSKLSSGSYSVRVCDGYKKIPPGLYLCRIALGGFTNTIKVNIHE